MSAATRTENDLPPAQDHRARRLMVDLEAVYRNQFTTFLRVATAITGDAESGRDAVQEAFARAIRRRNDFRGDGPLEGWLWRTVINVAKDHGRAARSRVPVAEFPDLAARATDAPTAGGHPEIRDHIAALPERQRHALFLRYYADQSYAEIGETLGIRTGTVSATLNAAHGTLRGLLDGTSKEGETARPARLPARRVDGRSATRTTCRLRPVR